MSRGRRLKQEILADLDNRRIAWENLVEVWAGELSIIY